MEKSDTDRRSEILSAAARCVVEEGIDGATIRRVAESLNASTGLLTHHFVNKKELIYATLEAAPTHIAEALDRVAGPGLGPARVDALFEVAFDKRDAQAAPWALFLEYWGAATRDIELQEIHARRASSLRVSIGGSLAKGVAEGYFASDLDVERATDLLVALFYGLGVEVSLDADVIPNSYAWQIGRLALELMTQRQRTLRIAPIARPRLARHKYTRKFPRPPRAK